MEDFKKLNAGQMAMRLFEMEADGIDIYETEEFAEYRRRCPWFKKWGD